MRGDGYRLPEGWQEKRDQSPPGAADPAAAAEDPPVVRHSPRRLAEKRRRQEARRKGQWLKGPVPMAWLRAAYPLGPAALRVAVELWFYKGLSKQRGLPATVKVTNAKLERETGASAASIHRALAQLEDAGLIRRTSGAGKGREITLLEAPPGAAGPG